MVRFDSKGVRRHSHREPGSPERTTRLGTASDHEPQSEETKPEKPRCGLKNCIWVFLSEAPETRPVLTPQVVELH
jgi:hypothetical protein